MDAATEPGARPGRAARTRLTAFRDGRPRTRLDLVAVEEPLEIRLAAGGARRTVAVTMRTPGNDFELAAGFLFSEGVVTDPAEVARVRYCTDPDVDGEQRYNVVTVELRANRLPALEGLERHFLTTSACGVCGKASIDAIDLRGCAPPPPGPMVTTRVLAELPRRLREAQGLFASTGGLHAAGLFDPDGQLVEVREDVGRHNAMDALVGWALLDDRLPLSEGIVMVSGRVSFELVQKALVAGAPIVCAVSAPTSLAVEVARRFGMTLVGFLRGDQFNVYAGAERVSDLGGQR